MTLRQCMHQCVCPRPQRRFCALSRVTHTPLWKKIISVIGKNHTFATAKNKVLLTKTNKIIMKKAFKLFGLALLATSLTFVACSKDEEEDENTNTNNQQQQEQPKEGVSYTFGGVAQTVGYYNGDYDIEDGTLYVGIYAAAAKNGSNYTLPLLEAYLVQEDGDWDEDGIYFYQNMTDCQALAEYAEVEDPQADWQLYSLDYEHTNLRWDAATKTMVSATLPYTLLSMKDYILDDKNMAESTKKPLTLTVTNYTLTAYTK